MCSGITTIHIAFAVSYARLVSLFLSLKETLKIKAL